MTRPIAKLPARFSETEVEDEVVLLAIDSGDFFSIRDSGREIWRLIDGTRTRDAILAELARLYGPAPAALAPDLDAYLAELAVAGFIDW